MGYSRSSLLHMPKLIEFYKTESIKTDWKTQYIRYRLGRLKHQYWLWNRKHKDQALIDEYDYAILQNCKPGKTAFFASAGYYLKDIFSEIEVIEMHPVVNTFYKDVHICTERKNLVDLPFTVDNFAVVNNRADHWVDRQGLYEHFLNYSKIMNPGCRVFYSFRDTQILINRLTNNLQEYFYDWARSLSTLGFTLVWHNIEFREKDFPLENPDTTNGNLKFWFVYKGQPWEIIND